MSKPRKTFFRNVRIAILLAILCGVALTTWREKRQIASWKEPLLVGVYPVAGESSDVVREYVAAVSAESFAGLEPFFQREAARFEIAASPAVLVEVGPEVKELPPPPPEPSDRTMTSVALWSLRLRWWNWRAASKYGLGPADVRLFAIYHAPIAGRTLEHSIGLERVRVGVAHLFASKEEDRTNEVVVAHELLHLVGASDKYDARGQPVHPEGYGAPNASPLHPQEIAEIMAGRLAISANEAKIPPSLDQCVVGPRTAQEIGWSTGATP
jgi:hypothetical protein